MDTVCWSEENKEFIEQKMSHFKNYPPVEPESLVCFK